MATVDPVNPPPITTTQVNSAARIREAQIAAANAAVEQQRQQAPSSVRAGSQQDAMIRQEASMAQQQSLAQVQAFNKANESTRDQFSNAREQALQSGNFNYASVGYASRGVPASYVDTLGNRIVVPQGGITGGGFTPGSMGLGSPTSKVSVMTDSGFIINISQSQLDRTNQLRSQQGLAPLQSVDKVNIVTGIQSLPLVTQQSKPTSRPSAGSLDLRSELAVLQGKAASLVGTPTEAVPFLSFTSPLVVSQGPTKTVGGRFGGVTNEYVLSAAPSKGTSLVPSTTILDALQFLPFGGIAGRGSLESFKGAGSLSGKILTTSGETIIPKGFKPPEEQNIFDNIINYFSKSSVSIKQSQPSIEQIALGRGIGREASTEEGGLSLSSRPSGKPPPEAPQTTSAGKGLEQIVKEKEEVPTKTETTTKTEPLREAEMQKYQQSLKEKAGIGSEQELETLFLPVPPQQKQKQELIGIPIIPTGLTGLATPSVIPKKQEQTTEAVNVVEVLTVQLTRGTNKIPEIPAFADIATAQVTRQTTKQTPEQAMITDLVGGQPTRGGETPPPDILGGGGIGAGLTGGGGISSGSSTVKSFVGNVPEFDIIGVYKREETIYGNPKTPKSSTAMDKLFKKKSGKIL